MIPTLAEIESILSTGKIQQLPTLRISILRNIMLETIESYLRYSAYRMGFNASVHFGEYDNIFQEAMGKCEDLLNNKLDCVMVFMSMESLSVDLTRNFNKLNAEQKDTEIQRIEEHIQVILHGIRRQTNAMILWHGFEHPVYPSLGIWDNRDENGQIAIVKKLNSYLCAILRENVNAYFVDTMLCVTRVGSKKFYDMRFWHIGRAPFSKEALCEITVEDSKYIRSLKGKNKKCLVLDCDNTLWGGIIDEDGLSGIKLDKSHPGSAYYEFQQEIVNLYNRGIIIALCSKNNEEVVWEVFRNHPDMVLKEEHIASAQINWRDKASNLRQISEDLNIGLDSIVFVDDSEFEVNFVRQMLPEVEVIHLPEGQAVEYRNILVSCGLFDTLTLSEEDRKRGTMYNAEVSRKKIKSQISDMITYYRSLKMVVDISFADEFTIPRIAQQTQKTNQFNLTTHRYNEAHIKHFIDQSNYDVICLKLTDKFCDSGIVGTCIIRYDGDIAIFDSFLLSCRVLGRGVEEAFLLQAIKLAKKRGCRLAVGEYYATSRNSQVEFFYSKYGIEQVNNNKENGKRIFHIDLTQELKEEPAYFKEINFN